MVDEDPQLFEQANQMFEQVPNTAPFCRDLRGNRQVRSFGSFLAAFDEVLTRAPDYEKEDVGASSIPVYRMVNWSIGTKSGNAFFSNSKVNDQIRNIFGEWARFLTSKASTYILNDSPSGWFCPSALDSMTGSTQGDGAQRFIDQFLCDPTQEHWGYQSWDHFFTREFRDGARRVASPEDWNIITHACEASPYHLATKVQKHDRFWLKGQPYSIQHLFNGHPLTAAFANGTVYQGFLDSTAYHRWHSPVDGFVTDVKHIAGTYFTKRQSEGFDPSDPVDSQSYITEVSSRVLIFIQADNPAIGLMCVVPIGWADVSTCDVTVETGQRVDKGAQLGMFHFGGSTHCLVFRPGVGLDFDFGGQTPGRNASTIPVNSKIAKVVPHEFGTVEKQVGYGKARL